MSLLLNVLNMQKSEKIIVENECVGDILPTAYSAKNIS